MDEDDDSLSRWPACHRCHTSKLRCRRDPSQRACKRCIRAQVECSPRPSRRGQQARTLNNVVSPPKGTGSCGLSALDLSMDRTVSPTAPPPKGLDSTGLDALDALDSRMLRAAMDSWPSLNEPDLLTPINSFLDQDFYHPPEVPTASSEPHIGFQNASGSEANESQAAAAAAQMDHTMNDGSKSHAVGRSRTSRLDAAVHELARINILLVNQQEAAVGSIQPLRASPQAHEYDGRSDHLNMEENLRIALQLLSILRRSAPAQDPATALLLLSCHSRLVAIFRNVFDCLQPILDRGSSSQGVLPRLFPRVWLGSICLGDGSERLQAEMVLIASERVFADISTKMELFIEESTRAEQHTECQRPIGDVLEQCIRVVREERSVVSELIGKLKRTLTQC